jgi:uncharacterized membrane protein HdeD (DUF308 family)
MNARAEQIRSSLESMPRHIGWALALRGVLAVVFGAIAIRSPNVAAAALVVVFAVYAIADGLLDFIIAGRLGRSGQRWGWYLFEGLATVAVGVIALAYPALTLMVLVLLVAIRAMAVGVFELVGAFSSEVVFSPEAHGARWLLGITGALSIILGILLLGSPVAGAAALIWAIGVYAIVYGVMLFAFGLRIVSSLGHMHHMRDAAPTA